ncbi:MAG: DUF3575 domain-containing protein [Microscillaceae bacterium]|jgi:hypothetical protein|nr:DUF3575 domain-containing protein [Microscillaceae bacterium]
MKKSLTLILSIIILITSKYTYAQGDRFGTLQKVKPFAIKTNTLNYIFNTPNVYLEYSLSDRHSVQVCYANFNQGWYINSENSGNMFTLEYRTYRPARRSRNRLYYAPYVRFQNLFVDGDGGVLQINQPGLGFLLGKEYRLVGDWLYLDAHLGINYIRAKYKIISQDNPNIAPNPQIPFTIYDLGARVGLSLTYRLGAINGSKTK